MRGSSRLAAHFAIPPLVIGLTTLNSTAAGEPLVRFKLIPTVLEVAEVAQNARVRYRLPAAVLLQVGLGDVGAEAATVVNENMIPGLVSGWLGFVRVIPSIASHTA